MALPSVVFSANDSQPSLIGFAQVDGFIKEASGIHVGEKQPAIPANLRLDNSFDGLEMLH